MKEMLGYQVDKVAAALRMLPRTIERYVAKVLNFGEVKANIIGRPINSLVMYPHVEFLIILCLQPIPGEPKDNGVAAMLDDRTFCFVIQHGRHAIVLLDLQGLVANQEWKQCLNTPKRHTELNNDGGDGNDNAAKQ